ncbi:hypothetical protein AYM40_20980 [Paraburkholderia phytofirmans OLGA172]|uniref:Uncharacterized protein n=2 Tax=Paraburkholderia phytofirmans TaxID=261302 RepID=A0A167W8S8_9BURK|nr:hypothetical protein AYM40_20980 [Paraburkholderia phytofirmans OLGA172]
MKGIFATASVRSMDDKTLASTVLTYINSSDSQSSLGADYGKGAAPVSLDDIQIGRSLMSGSTSGEVTTGFISSSPDTAVRVMAALRNAFGASAADCASMELTPLATAKARADDASAFVIEIGQRQVGFQEAVKSNGEQQIDLGKFSVSDKKLVREAMRLHSTGAFCAMAQDRAGKMARFLVKGDKGSADSEKPIFNAARFLIAYETAYFRNGHVVAVSVDTQAAATKIVSELPKDIQTELGAGKATLTTSIASKLQEICQTKPADAKSACLVTGSLGATSFVSRSGQSVQFSGVTVSVGEKGELKPNFEYPKVATFAPQIVKVFVEAVFDGAGPTVPAVATSTACTQHLYSGSDCLAGDSAHALPDSGKPPTTMAIVDRIDTDAASADAFATSMTGLAIRGANIAALNNEAVADSIAAFAGVTMRKTVEKIEWIRANSPESGGVCSSRSLLATDTHD